jgi:hypothetical protein
MTYSDDNDLLKIRASILSLGVDDWSEYHETAAEYIHRDIEALWFRRAARDKNISWTEWAFKPELILKPEELKDLSCAKTLALIYRYLAQDTSEKDAFGAQRDYWEKAYKTELDRLVAYGLAYDWDESGEYDAPDMKAGYRRMSLGRC